MGIEIKREGRQVAMVLSDELTIYTVAETKAALASIFEETSEVEIDLSGVNEMDTAGLQFMLIAKRYPGKAVRFVNHPPAVLRLVDLANLGSALGDPLFIAAERS